MERKIEVKETVNKDFNFFQVLFALLSKWRPWHVHGRNFVVKCGGDSSVWNHYSRRSMQKWRFIYTDSHSCF